MKVRVVLRAASGASIGAGHVRRTRAVAQGAIALGVPPRLVVDDEPTAEALRAEGFDAASAEQDPGWPTRPAAGAWLDGFRDWSAELGELRRVGMRSVLVENRTARELCDHLVHPALHFQPDGWERDRGDRVRGGAEWIPLAREIVAAPRAKERDVGVLVTFGGSDPGCLTERTLIALATLDDPCGPVVVTIGTHMEGRRAGIERLAASLPDGRVLPRGAELAPWIARSRSAVTALGTTLYELAHLGVPALIVANYAADRGALRFYAEHGPHHPLGIADELSDADLRTALRDGLAAVEGSAGFRVAGLGEGAARIVRLLIGMGEGG